MQSGYGPDALRIEKSIGGGSYAEVSMLATLGGIDGVRWDYISARNGPGVGQIESSGTGYLIRWQAPGSSTPGPWVAANDGETVVLCDGEDPDSYVRVTIDASFISGARCAAVFLADRYNNAVGSDDVSAAEALAGDTEDYTLSLRNAGPNALTDLRCWLDASSENISISIDGVNYYSPTSETHANVLLWSTLASGSRTTLYIRRTIAASTTYDPSVLAALCFGWKGL